MKQTAKHLAAACLALAGAVVAYPAAAVVVSYQSTSAYGNPAIYTSMPLVDISGSDVGQSFGVNWNLPASITGLSTDLTANGQFDILSFDSNDLVIKATINNTTDSMFQAAIMSLALAVTPDATGSVVQAGSVFQSTDSGSGPQQTFPGGFKNIDVCLYNTNGCSGTNINDGLQSGTSDSVTFKLTASTPGGFGTTPHATVGALGIKWQTQGGSFEMPGSPFLVPEPETALLFLSGLIGLAASRGHLGRNRA